MSASRLLMLTLVLACGCKQLSSHSSAADNGEQALPSLYAKDYGTIEYTDTYRGQVPRAYIVDSMESRINTFWAQEAIGTPEARTLLAEMHKEGFAFSSPKLGIADNGFDWRQEGHPRFSSDWNEALRDDFDSFREVKQALQERAIRNAKHLNNLIENEGKILLDTITKSIGDVNAFSHGTKTLGIVAGEHPVGVSTHGKVHELFIDVLPSKDSANWKLLDVVNASLNYESIPELKEVSEDVSEVKRWSPGDIDQELVDGIKKLPATTLWVNGAGNNFPYPIEDTKRQIKDKVILVGSADPSGFPSQFSQADEGVVVLAPSDYFLQSIDADGKLVTYGGTSGATPMVSGVLADVKAILPDLTRDEAVQMLQITATRTSINSVSKVNGAGMLNHYKMLRVAQRIAERLQQDSTATISSLLQDPKIARFHDETAQLLADVRQAHKLGNRDEMFKKLRQAFFLTDSRDPSCRLIRSSLSSFYTRAGQPVSADFYRTPMSKDNWEYALYKYKETITRNRKVGRTKLGGGHETIAHKLQHRNERIYHEYSIAEINNLSAWIKETKGKRRLKKITGKLSDLKQTLLTNMDTDMVLYDINTEIDSYQKATLRNIVFAASAKKEFTNKDIKLMLEYAKEAFDDIDPAELRHLKGVCKAKGRIKNSSNAVDSMDNLIKALL